MSYHSWHVGMKVVCVKEGVWEVVTGDGSKFPKPKFGEICEISRIDLYRGRVYIAVLGYDQFDLLWAKNFRPVQTRKTDISIFTAILNGARVPEGV